MIENETQSTNVGEEVTFASDYLALHGRYFKAQGKPRGNFLLLHGLTSNSAWFGKIATVLSSRGYNVLAYDRRGSGQSEGAPGDVPNPDAFLWDLHAAMDYARERSSVPFHLIAFSYSWKLPPVFIKSSVGENSEIESLIFVAPASDLNPRVKPSLIDRVKILINWGGEYHESPVRETDLTQNPKTLKWIRTSGESRPQLQFTRRFFLASNSMDKAAGEIIPGLKKPMLVLLPRRDQVIDRERVRRRFTVGPAGFLREVLDIDGGHIVDSPEAQDDLTDKVLAWINPVS